MLRFRINIPSNINEKDIRGKLVSFFDSVIEICEKRRKPSYIIHFWRERLSRTERRAFLLILTDFITQLEKDPTSQSLSEGKVGDANLPSKAKVILNMFRELKL